MAALALGCYVQAFSSCGERGLSPVVALGLLIVVAVLLRARALGIQASVAAVHELSSWGSWALVCTGFSSCGCSTTCEIFPGQGSNPGSLHWQEDSYPLYHQGNHQHYLFKSVLCRLKSWSCDSSFEM